MNPTPLESSRLQRHPNTYNFSHVKHGEKLPNLFFLLYLLNNNKKKKEGLLVD